MTDLYGPKRPEVDVDIDQLTLPSHLTGIAAKILRDVKLKAGLYDGVDSSLYRVEQTATRCPNCIDAMTGAQLFTHCTVCDGTGYTGGYAKVGDFKIYIQIGPREVLETQSGNTDNSGGRKDAIIFFGMPLLKDSDLLLLVDTGEIYKVEDLEPQITSMQGYVILQTVACSRLTPGCKEYSLIP